MTLVDVDLSSRLPAAFRVCTGCSSPVHTVPVAETAFSVPVVASGMVSSDRLLDSRFAHVVVVVLGVVGALAITTGAALSSGWFWIVYGLVWLAFLDTFDDDRPFWETFTGGDESDSVDRESDDEPEVDPVAVLKRRYAEGEIDDDEFDERLDRLLETPDTLAELEATVERA